VKEEAKEEQKQEADPEPIIREKTHEEKEADDYDMSPEVKYFKKFGDVLYDTRAYNATTP